MSYQTNVILDMVKARMVDVGVVQKQNDMDNDLDLFDMKEFDANSVEGTPLGSHFRSFTSNEPRSFADKIISLLTSGALIMNVPYMGGDQGERERYELAERFWEGAFAQADERLEMALMQRLKVQIATQLSLRGTAAARVLIQNGKDDKSWVSIKPFDVRHSVWQAGDEGLLWFCNVMDRHVAQVRQEYPNIAMSWKDEDVVTVYDFYDDKYNTVMVEGGPYQLTRGVDLVMKKRTAHGQEGVPIVLVPGGSYSNLKGGPLNRQPIPPGYGESIYASVRRLYPILNEVMSLYLELVAHARDQTFVLYSDDDIEVEQNPNEPSGVLHLGSRDKLQPVELPQSTRDAAQLVGLVQAMIQRGTLPQTAFGELAFQLSGFAITQLRQSLFSTMEPNLIAMSSFYRQAAMKLTDQIVSNNTNPLVLSGQDRNRNWFQETFTGADLKNIPSPRVKIAPQLPQDDAQKLALAQGMRQGPVPLLPDTIILEEILEMQDAGKIQQMVKEQVAESAHPAAKAIVLAKAMLDRGREDIAAIYLQEVEKALNPAPRLPGIGGGPPGLPGPIGPGLPPGILPPEALAMLGTQGRPTQGPQVPPGAPRPGATGPGPTLP